jgi:Putative transposase
MLFGSFSVVHLSTLSGAIRIFQWLLACVIFMECYAEKVVVRYLGRYTHRVAISNHRLLSFDDGRGMSVMLKGGPMTDRSIEKELLNLETSVLAGDQN